MAARALADAPPRFAVAGLSMGGYVAFEIWRQAPERVARLALFDTSAQPDSEEQSRRRRGLIALARSGQFRGVTPRLIPLLLAPDNQAGPLAAEVMEMAERVGRDAFLRQQAAILARADSRPDLPAITAPTLVAVGEHDALTPPDRSREIAAGIHGARLAVIPGAGHLPTMEAPAAASSLLAQWLAD
jgi:pimeloyl-ACP methyl ester carboxylesterase